MARLSDDGNDRAVTATIDMLRSKVEKRTIKEALRVWTLRLVVHTINRAEFEALGP